MLLHVLAVIEFLNITSSFNLQMTYPCFNGSSFTFLFTTYKLDSGELFSIKLFVCIDGL